MKISELNCNDTRPCFAKRYKNGKKCSVLISNGGGFKEYENGECPFCKIDRDVTNGKVYPAGKFIYK